MPNLRDTGERKIIHFFTGNKGCKEEAQRYRRFIQGCAVISPTTDNSELLFGSLKNVLGLRFQIAKFIFKMLILQAVRTRNTAQ